MAFDAGAIKARMQLDNRAFKAGLQSTMVETKKFDRAMGAVFKSGLWVTGVSVAARQIYNLANSAARLDTLSDAFERMAGGAANANAILAQSRAVTGALADRDLKAAANQLELLGIGMKNLPRFVEIARSAAIGLGQDVGFMLQSLSTGTARQSRLWLDNLGIIISVEEANEAYARSLGKTAKELTDNEERAAFLFAVLDKGQTIIDKVGASSETSAEKVMSLGAAFRNLADAVNQLMIDAKLPEVLSALAAFIRGGGMTMAGAGGVLNALGIGLGGGATPPWTTTNVGMPGMDALAAQFREEMEMRRLRNLGGPVGAEGPRRGRGANTFVGLDWREVSDPGLTLGTEEWQRSFDLIGSGLSTLGDSFAGFFEMLLTDSKNAGRAFFSGLMSGFSGVASSLGDLYIQAGIGMLGLMKLSPLMSIAAGFALKAIGGVLRGIAFNNAPVSVGSGVRSIRNPLVNGGELRGSFTLIVQGDFIGDRMWVDRLREKMRLGERNFGAPSAQWGGA